MNFNLFANMISLLGADVSTSDIRNQTWYANIVDPILTGINYILLPIIILAASLGMIYAVKLGIDLAKAESADKREEAKNKMIYFIIAFVVTMILLILLQVFISNADAIFQYILDMGKTSTPVVDESEEVTGVISRLLSVKHI